MKYFAVGVILLGIISSIFGRSFASEPPAGTLLREDDFVDVDLPIASHKESDDKSLTVIGRGEINDKTVALAVDLAPEWKAQIVEDAELTIYWGTGTIRSVGPESDSLLALLAQEYRLPLSHPTMAARVPVTVAGLNSDPRVPSAGKLTMKVFFEHGAEENYGEAFINIDLGAGVLEFHDKDPEYHAGILASLGAGT